MGGGGRAMIKQRAVGTSGWGLWQPRVARQGRRVPHARSVRGASEKKAEERSRI